MESFEITKERTKKGNHQYYVVLESNKDGKGKWTNESEIQDPTKIQDFKSKSVVQKERPPKYKPKKVEKIIGIVSKDPKIVFLVKFNGDASPIEIPIEQMRKFYSKPLLNFYEKHLNFIESGQ